MAGVRPGVQSGQPGAISIVTLGLSLSLFFVISFVICIAGYLLAPGFPVQHASLRRLIVGRWYNIRGFSEGANGCGLEQGQRW